MTTGFDVANNDDDTGGGRTVQTVWNGTGDNWFNTISFGDLTLAGAGTALTWTKIDDGSAAVTYTGVKGAKNASSSGTEIIVDAFAYATTGAGCTAGGTILREQWNGITGGAVHNLTGSPNYPNSPSSSSQLTLFEGPTNVGDSYGSRIRGYVCAPETGNYTFWIASDDNSELWLSTSDNPANKVLIASINGWAGVREWGKYTTQQSVAIPLTAGGDTTLKPCTRKGAGATTWRWAGSSPPAPSKDPSRARGCRLVEQRRPAAGAARAEAPDDVLRVYPVPANGKATLVFRAEAAGEVTVQVYDLFSRRKLLVKAAALRGENKLELATGTLEDGIYLINLTTGGKTLTRKLVTRR